MADPYPLFHFDAETGALIVDDSDSLERLLRKTWSPSAAKSVHSCPARWVAEKLDDSPDDPFGSAALGTAGHLVSEVLHGLAPEERTPERADQILLSLWDDYRDEQYQLAFPAVEMRTEWEQAVRQKIAGLFVQENWRLGDEDTATLVAKWDPGTCDPETRTGRWHNQKRCPNCRKLQERWSEDATNFAGYVAAVVAGDGIPDPRNVLAVECERALESEVNGVPFFGRIDRTDRISVEDHRLKIVDTKTGGPKSAESRAKFGDDHGDQLRLYAIAVEHADGEMPAEVEIHYTATGEVYRASLNRRDMARVAREFRETWDEMVESYRRNSYQARDSALCGWCPLVRVCPTALAKNKQDKSGNGQWAIDRCVQVRTGDSGVQPLSPYVSPLTTDVKAQMAEEREGRPADIREEVLGMTQVASQPSTEEPAGNRLFSEGKSWDEAINGRPNANGYAMQACFGLSEMAAEILLSSGEGEVRPDHVTALAQTLLDIILEAQVNLNSSESLMDGLNTRLRGALRSALAIRPVPFGADSDGWAAWRRTVVRIIESLARTSLILFRDPIPVDPWSVFVPHAEAAPTAAPSRTPRKTAKVA